MLIASNEATALQIILVLLLALYADALGAKVLDGGEPAKLPATRYAASTPPPVTSRHEVEETFGNVTAVSPATLAHPRRARDLRDRRYMDALDLNAMALEAGFSRYHFARSFRTAFGESPAAYLTRRRVERAKDLIRSANLPITEICYLVGFSSLASRGAVTRIRA